jgi:hypothetical protein
LAATHPTTLARIKLGWCTLIRHSIFIRLFSILSPTKILFFEDLLSRRYRMVKIAPSVKRKLRRFFS